MTRIQSYALPIVAAATAFALLTLDPQPARAHGGGTPRLTGDNDGPYLIYAWSQPEPLRAGETHLTVGVTVPAAGREDAGDFGQDEYPITDADVTVTYTRMDADGEAIVVQAEPQESLGIVYYEADVTLPASGQWRSEVSVTGPTGDGSAEFVADVAAPRRLNNTVIAVTGAAIVVLLAALLIQARRRDTNTKAKPSGRPQQRRRSDDVKVAQPKS